MTLPKSLPEIKPAEGWGRPQRRLARLRHYWRDGRTLCGKFDAAAAPAELALDLPVELPACAKCRRRERARGFQARRQSRAWREGWGRELRDRVYSYGRQLSPPIAGDSSARSAGVNPRDS